MEFLKSFVFYTSDDTGDFASGDGNTVNMAVLEGDKGTARRAMFCRWRVARTS